MILSLVGRNALKRSIFFKIWILIVLGRSENDSGAAKQSDLDQQQPVDHENVWKFARLSEFDKGALNFRQAGSGKGQRETERILC